MWILVSLSVRMNMEIQVLEVNFIFLSSQVDRNKILDMGPGIFSVYGQEVLCRRRTDREISIPIEKLVYQ